MNFKKLVKASLEDQLLDKVQEVKDELTEIVALVRELHHDAALGGDENLEEQAKQLWDRLDRVAHNKMNEVIDVTTSVVYK